MTVHWDDEEDDEDIHPGVGDGVCHPSHDDRG